LSETSNLPLPERVTRYRAQAHELRAKAAHYPSEIRAAFFRIAGYWEQLALEAEAKAEKQAAAAMPIIRLPDPPPLRASVVVPKFAALSISGSKANFGPKRH
jgi:hypothetical protein